MELAIQRLEQKKRWGNKKLNNFNLKISKVKAPSKQKPLLPPQATIKWNQATGITDKQRSFLHLDSKFKVW
jgi:hypothetical protein